MPASPPKHNSPPKPLPPPKPTGPALRALCTGDHQSPRTPNKLDRGPLPPRRRCSLHADRATTAHPKQQSPPKRGGQSQRTRCAHSHKLVLSLHGFTPFLPRCAPFLPHFYPVFTPFCFVVLPRFYPVFTLFLPRSAPSFSPPFYPLFTPLVKGKMLNLPRFYPVFTPRPVFTLSTVLPPFYPGPSTLCMPIPPFLPPG